MSTLIIPVGIPGSGKSTWARKQHAVIVSSDAIRMEFVSDLRDAHAEDSPVSNELVFAIYQDRIEKHLRDGRDVIADATNVTARARKNLVDIAERTGAQVGYVVFSDIGKAIQQNKNRAEDQIVPDDVMLRMIGNFGQSVIDLHNQDASVFSHLLDRS